MIVIWIHIILLAFLRLARLIFYVLNVIFDIGLCLFICLLIVLTFVRIQTWLYIEWSCVMKAIRWLIDRIHFHSFNYISIYFTTAFVRWYSFATRKQGAFRVDLAWIIVREIIWKTWVLLQKWAFLWYLVFYWLCIHSVLAFLWVFFDNWTVFINKHIIPIEYERFFIYCFIRFTFFLFVLSRPITVHWVFPWFLFDILCLFYFRIFI